MRMVALELSTAVGSVATCNRDGALIVRRFPNDRKDSGPFFQYLAELRREFGPPELIVVGLGPGSYAGTRIALATAVGLRRASGARMVGYPSVAAFDSPEYLALGDARRGSFSFAHVLEGRCVSGPRLATEKELQAELSEHEQLPRFSSTSLPQFPRLTIDFPSAAVLLRLTKDVAILPIAEPLEPIYLRPPHITQPKNIVPT